MFVKKERLTIKSIKDFSIEELEAEINRQKEMAVPTMIESPVITEKLLSGCKEYIACIQQKQSVDNCEHFIFQAAIDAIFGPDIWEWINKNV